MRVITVETGAMRCNNYLVINEETNQSLLIDCGGSGEELIRTAQKEGVTIEAIFLTHGHADHIEGTERVAQKFGCPVYLHEADLDYLKRPEYNLSQRIYMKPFTYEFTPASIGDGDCIEAAGLSVKVLHTPGHTLGCVCFQIEDLLFTGDTLFRESVGGDFPPFGNLEQELRSIRTRLYSLDGEWVCYPGHGAPTTLSYEMKNNLYCRI